MLTDLHAPLIPILRHAFALAPLPRAGLVLDLACGQGLKAPLLAEVCGPQVRLLGIDIDRVAIRAMVDQRPTTNDQRGTQPGDKRSSILDPRFSEQPWVVGIVADALALPLVDGCCAAAFCIAALSLFADPRAALRELRRVLAPGGVAIFVVGTQSWAQTIRWPADLAAHLVTAYAQALAEGHAPLPASADLSVDLANLLRDTGFASPLIRAFQLDRPMTNDQRPTTNDEEPRTKNQEPRTENPNPKSRTLNCERLTTDNAIMPQPPNPNPQPPSPIPHPLLAELSLLPWPALRSLLVERIEPAELARCDALAADPEVELCALALVAQAQAA
jgi:SAM-dependent methyltransferase